MSAALIDRLAELSGRSRQLQAEDVLFRANDPVSFLFVVLSGEVRLVRPLPHGTALTLQRAGAGTILAEASLFSRAYHCDAIATAGSRVRAIPVRRIKEALAADPDLSLGFMRHLATEVQSGRAHAEVLSLKTVAERLDAWLALHEGQPPARGRQRHLAAELGVTPEALYRELARRRQPGRAASRGKPGRRAPRSGPGALRA